MNNSNMRINQWNQPNSNNQPPPPPVTNPIAHYTLPGVINYLTSEFTNLERFKIMTNLEKSEMKYRITQLQGEINSLKYINQQQKVKIDSLEQELKGFKNEEPNTDPVELIDKIPEVDLQTIKDARYQLTKSMREVINLLRSPVNANLDYLELPDIENTTNSFDELFSNEKDKFVFNGYNKESNGTGKSAVAKYFQSETQPIESPPPEIQVQKGPNEDGLSSKFDDLSLESDTETVVLDGSNELNFSNGSEQDTSALDREIEPEINVEPEISLDPPESLNLVESNIEKIADDYQHSKLFNNKLNDILVYLHYNVDESAFIQLYDLKTKKSTLNFKCKGQIKNFDDIVDIYCIDHSSEIAVVLIVYSNGEINQLVLDQEDPLSTSIIKLIDVELNSSALIKFDHKTTESSKYFGLVITYKDENNQFKVKVFELITGPRHDLQHGEIGCYNKGFFRISSSNEESKFEAIKWIKTSESITSSPRTKKTHKQSFTGDESLSPYQPLIKFENSLYVVNVYSNHFHTLTDYLSNFHSHLEGNDPFLALTTPVDDTSFQLETFDLSKTSNVHKPAFNKPNIINTLQSYNKDSIFTSIRSGTSNYILEIGSSSLTLYDSSFELIDSKQLAYKNSYRVGDYIVFEGNSSLTVFTIG